MQLKSYFSPLLSKTFIFFSALLLAMPATAQEDEKKKNKKDDIKYYTDSYTKHSRFSLAANLHPVFLDRRILNNELNGGSGFDVNDENSEGSFKINYGLDVFYSLSSNFDFGVGIGITNADYTVNDVTYSYNRTDTITVQQSAEVQSINVPFKINFSSQLTDIFWLEIVPTVELNFLSKYVNTFTPADASIEKFSVDFGDDLRKVNYSAGIGLGGRFYMAERWNFFIRGNIKYMLNDLVLIDGFPRETLFGIGSTLGFRYSF